MKQYLGFDVGGTSIKVGVVCEDASIVHHERLPIPPDYDAFMQQLSDCYHRLKGEFPAICGVGISSCGGIDPSTGEANYAVTTTLSKRVKRLLIAWNEEYSVR